MKIDTTPSSWCYEAAHHRAVALAVLRQPTITHHASREGASRFRRVVRLPLKAAPLINSAIDAICHYSFNWRARKDSCQSACKFGPSEGKVACSNHAGRPNLIKDLR